MQHKILTPEEADALIESPAGLPEIQVPAPIWRAAGSDDDPRALLKGIWRLGPVSLHVFAVSTHIYVPRHIHQDGELEGQHIRYRTNDPAALEEPDALMEFDAGAKMPEAGSIWIALGMEGACETLEIDGRDYTVFAHPFCR